MESDAHGSTTSFESLKHALSGLDADEHVRYHQENVKNMISLVNQVPDFEGSSQDSQTQPPLDLLIYTIRLFLYLPVDNDHTSDLLTLICNVEFWRQRVLKRISGALVFDSYLAGSPGTAEMPYSPLSEDSKSELKMHSDTAVKWRQVFMAIARRCITKHLQYLWLNDRDAFQEQWEEYFSVAKKRFLPDENSEMCDGITHSFQYRLSPKEIDMLVDAMKDGHKFMSWTCDEARNYRRKYRVKKPIEDVLASEEFQYTIQIPTIEEDRGLLDIYLNHVLQLTEDEEEFIKNRGLPLS